MHDELSLAEIKKEWHGTYRSYAIGFICSLLLTGCSFLLVVSGVLSREWVTYTIIGLALIQAIIQLLYFLHVGQEAQPKWETLIFCFMVIILLIVAIGTLWIMNDLNHRVMKKMEHTHD